MVYQNTGEYEQAAVNYRKAISLEPDSSRIRLNYASFLYQQGDYAKAAKELEIVTDDTLYPKRELAFANLGRCYLRMEDMESAEKAFMRAYLMDRRSPGIKLELASTYFQLANYSEAQKFYDAFRDQVSTQSPQALWLGIQLAAQYNDRNALASYGLALKNLYPKSNEYLQYKSQYQND